MRTEPSSTKMSRMPVSLKSRKVVSSVMLAAGASTARALHRERGREDRSADAEAERVDLLLAADLPDDGDRAQDGAVDVVVPGALGDLLAGVLPAHHEDAMALGDGVADQRVLGLQVEDVELVDARRHEQDRPLVHLRRQRRVLEQLEELVLEDHRAARRRDVAADLERALVGLRQVAALGVVPELGQPVQQALAVGLDRLLLRFRIEGEEVARRRRVDPLQHGETDSRLRLRVGVDALGEPQQRARVEQVHLGEEGR